MNPKVFIVLSAILGVAYLLYYFIMNYYDKLRSTYAFVTDKELLFFINKQPDRMITTDMVKRKFGISKTMASGRLQSLQQVGILGIMYNSNSMKGYYKLSEPLADSYDVELSYEPFMTLEDLVRIFVHFDFEVTYLELIMVTGLPLRVIKREMKYFMKEKVVNILYAYDANTGATTGHQITLNEPYRSRPEAFMDNKEINLELKEIYHKAMNKDFV